MDKLAENILPLYSSMYDEERFRLVTVEKKKKKDDAQIDLSTVEKRRNYFYNFSQFWLKPCSEQDLYHCLLAAMENEREDDDLCFYLSCLILNRAESQKRVLLKRLIKPSSRNIKLSPVVAVKYLRDAVSESIERDKEKKMPEIVIKQLDDLLEESFVGIKHTLGFPDIDPAECFYKVTLEVIAAANDENCKKYLNEKLPEQYIFPLRFERICKELREKYSLDAENVISVFKNTRSRDHRAVFSLSTENDQPYISMVNPEKSYIKMESWKFLQLIEKSETALRLHDFEKKRMQTPDNPFEFNNFKEGYVVGKFNAQESVIYIACLDENSVVPKEHSVFYIEISYALCLYSMLKRLDRDRETFRRLKEKAKTAMPVKDIFDSLHINTIR